MLQTNLEAPTCFHLLGSIDEEDTSDNVVSEDETADQDLIEGETADDDDPDPRSIVIADILADYTLADLFEEKLNAERASSVAFVTMEATLSDTIAAMRDVEDMRSVTCSDAFVTRSGDPSEPVIGWITEAGIRRVMASMA